MFLLVLLCLAMNTYREKNLMLARVNESSSNTKAKSCSANLYHKPERINLYECICTYFDQFSILSMDLKVFLLFMERTEGLGHTVPVHST